MEKAFLKLWTAVREGPENRTLIFFECHPPVWLGMNLFRLGGRRARERDLGSISKFDRIIVEGGHRVEVIDNGREVDTTVVEDVLPEGGREGRCSPSGNEALVGSLGTMLIDISEYVSFLPDAEVVCVRPRCPAMVKPPVPCIEQVVIVRDFSESFKGAP